MLTLELKKYARNPRFFAIPQGSFESTKFLQKRQNKKNKTSPKNKTLQTDLLNKLR